MDEPTIAETARDQPISYSLRQTIAVMTAVGAGFALCYILLSPPIGSSGLVEALLPGGMLAIAIWFCRDHLTARLGTWAVVASLLAFWFFAAYFRRTDWLFGHTHGPPQLIVATCWASLVGVVAGSAWAGMKLSTRLRTAASEAVPGDNKLAATRWLGASVIVLLTLLSGLLLFASLLSLPHAVRRMDSYIRQRQINAEIFGRHSQRTNDPIMQTRPEIPDIIARDAAQLADPDLAIRRQAASRLRAVVRSVRDESPQARLIDQPATKAALIRALDDDDAIIRMNVAMAIVELKDQVDREVRLRAIAALGKAQPAKLNVDAHAQQALSRPTPDAGQIPLDFQYVLVTLQRVLDDRKDHECRVAAIRALGRIGSAGGTSIAAPVAAELEQGDPVERAAAAEALAAMGPAAQPFAFVFGRAWQRRLITLNQAQLLYKIDPQAAATFNIPRP